MLRIYNSLKRKKEDFKPIEKGKAKLYVCGPTVYDVPHIGHARSAFVFEIIRRYMEFLGYDVMFVRNVTDIDDKIVDKAISELSDMGQNISPVLLKTRVKEVSKRYLDLYHNEMDILGIRQPIIEPLATEYIAKMILAIERLVNNEYAYVNNGNVYFDVEKVESYGKLSNQDIDKMDHTAEKSKDKRNLMDFALWKTAKENEPYWDSPWGRGRPGWHIECSVMSTDILGEQFDIHGGGLDLIFPHHENEIAQAEALTGKPFANYWVHNGLLTVNGEKMAKSLNNYVRIPDFLQQYKDADLLKLAFLNSHYSSPMDYTDEKIREAKKSKERILVFQDKVERLKREMYRNPENAEEFTSPEVIESAQALVNSFQEKFEDAMDDDFNTSRALAAIFEAVKTGNEYLINDSMSIPAKVNITNALKNYVFRFSDLLCLSLNPVQNHETDSVGIEDLIQARETARVNKDYSLADKLRDELAQKGIVVEDTPEGPIWRRE